MRIPPFKLTSLLLKLSILVAVAVIGTAGVSAQKSRLAPTLIPTAADVDQCAQLTDVTCSWQNGNLNENNSNYFEGDSVAYRMVFDDVAAGSTGNTVILEYDTTESGGEHTLDYLTTFNRTVVGADPCKGVTGCSLAVGNYTEWAIPLDAYVTAGCNPAPDGCQQGGMFRLYNGTITAVSSITYTPGGPIATHYAGASTSAIMITFSADANGDDPVLAWGGHISTRIGWGVTESAINLPGSPYHMRRGDGGGADRSLKVSAVTFPARITIIKEVRTITPDPPPAPQDQPGTTATFEFGFNKTQNAVVTPFTLVDDVLGDGGGNPLSANATEVFSGITSFGSNVLTVQENNYLPTWTLSSITCVSEASGLPSTNNNVITLASRSVSFTLEEGEFSTCTFRNTQLEPTAAPASISGRVANSDGYGVAFARVVVQNASTGETRSALTNNFGYYTVEGLATGDFYMISVNHKRYSFPTQFLTLDDNVSGFDFTANPE